MRRPGVATIGSVLLHAAVAGLALFPWPRAERPAPVVASVPVSIVSSETVAAAPADNPADELIPDSASEPSPPLEAEVPPEPTPPTPAPTPTPRPAEKAPAPRPTPRPTPPRPTPPRPTPERPTPPRPNPSPPRKEPSLDLDALARPSTNTNRNRPATGDRGQGQAARAIGRASLQALGAQVRPTLNCDLPGADGTLVRVIVRLGENGRIIGSPRLQGPRNPIADSVLRAIQAAQPFDMPAGYEEQDIPFAFNTESWC